MGKILNPQMPRLIPDKYDKNQFTATAWYHIDRHWRHRGEHLSYEKFKHLDDPLARQCRPNVFEDTLASYKLDLVLAPSQPEPPPIKVVAMEEPTAKTNLGDAIIAGLKKQQDRYNREGELVGGPKREPLTAARRQEASEWIWSHMNEGIAAFQAVFPEPEFDHAWWSKMRHEGLRKEQAAKENAAPVAQAAGAAEAAPTEMENSMAQKEMVFDPRVKEPVKKACRWLLTLGTSDRIRGMTHSVYVEKTKDRNIEYHQFAKARELVIRHLSGEGDKRTKAEPAAKPKEFVLAPPPAEAAPRARRASKPGKGGGGLYAGRTATVVLATVSTATVNNVDAAKLRIFVQEILAQVAPEQPTPQIVFMSDPPTMEIRAQVQL